MKNNRTKFIGIFSMLAALMATTRFEHFGSAVALADASLAVFFLGGLYLSGNGRLSLAAIAALIIEAWAIDYYVTTTQGISDWCMTPAYWFLVPTYGSLWLAGRWVALRKSANGGTLEKAGLLNLSFAAWAASSFAFVFSNATFYFFSGRFAEMGWVEYAVRVSEYYVSYVSFAMFYVGCATAIQMIIEIASKQSAYARLKGR